MTTDARHEHAASGFRPPVPQPIEITGPAGSIEARVEDPVPAGEAHSFVGVACHPHPLHGGTMQNKVVHTCARAMQEVGAATVRFNFRGVGRSDGRYDAGHGELEDALAVVAWTRRRFQCDTLWLAGFSFGAAVALQAAVRGARPSRLVTIAPPVGRIITEPVVRPECAWLIVQGDRDELVDLEAVRRWAAAYDPAPQLLVVPGAEHFFHGKLIELRKGIVRFLRKEVSEGSV
ncbi:MAG TPA: alpha/beta fold hydrolase [Steroidobacteraceae bacterium]|nr:alpha/beta fold hydrolase [Steroidobacteraceae bacterium]